MVKTDSVFPEPGVHPRIPAEKYFEWAAISRSHLEAARRSLAHMKQRMIQPVEATPAMLLGRAAHSAILEPDEFGERYCVFEGERRTKDGKAQYSELIERHGAGYVLNQTDYDKCVSMRDAVWANQSAKALLGKDGDTELSIAWQDDETELLCKARLDRVSWKLAGGTIVDLKTTKDASRAEFERAIFNLGYHRQGGYYMNGVKARKIDMNHYTTIAVEKEEPFAVAVYRMTEGALEAGMDQIRPLMRKVRECMETDVWPGYVDEVVDIALPEWAWSKIEQELSEGGQ